MMGRKRRKYRGKPQELSSVEQAVALIHGLRFNGRTEAIRRNLLYKYMTGSLSDVDKHRLIRMAKRAPNLVDEQKQPYEVYAISDGDYIKVGFSRDPEKRLKELQTGQPRKLQIIRRRVVVGQRRARAKEKKIHRLARQHRVRGEWYSSEILEVFNTA